MNREAVIVDAVRTPVGKRGGQLRGWHPVDLLAQTLSTLVGRTGIDHARLSGVIAGCAIQSGEQAGNVARNGILGTGLPLALPGTTIDRQCGSGQQAVHVAARAIKSGEYDFAIGAGVESMSRVDLGPLFIPGGPRGTWYGERALARFGGNIPAQGPSAELSVSKWGLTRQQLDDYSIRSHQRAAAATEAGYFASQLVPLDGVGKDGTAAPMTGDEGIRAVLVPAKMAALTRVFSPDGAITAANASQMSDGAAALLIAERSVAEAAGLRPRARIVSMAVADDDPVLQFTAVLPATQRALDQAGLSITDMDLVELNEAFAPVPLLWAGEFGHPQDQLNVNGGSFAIGHPLGSTGARLLTQPINELEHREARYGLLTICEGDDVQLNATTLIRRAARTHGDREIVYRTNNGGWDRYTYAGAYERIQRGANALRSLGVGPATRVGVIDWNSRRHFELYWAIPGLAAVMVQLNLRLGPEDLSYVISDSDTSVICVDESLLPLADAVAPSMPSVTTWIIMSNKPMNEIQTSLPNAHHYEDLLAASQPDIDWPEVDERSAYSACYTTGTTGRPKGVFYSHRAIYLHSYAIAVNVGMTLQDCTMLITAMFHGQAWGLPQAATLMANKIVLPGRYYAEDTGALTDALIAEGLTITNGAPVIFLPMLHYIETLEAKPDLSRLRMLSGATEPPLPMMRGFKDLTGAETVHAYGATETTPLVTMNTYKPSVRGPWVTSSYHNMPAEELVNRFVDGYWRSGDVGTIDADGYLKVTDRIKNVIKSGGEWISSTDMENLLLSHPGIGAAAGGDRDRDGDSAHERGKVQQVAHPERTRRSLRRDANR